MPTDDLTHRLQAISKAVNDSLVAAHGLRFDLAAHHKNKGDVQPPFWKNQGDLSEVENEQTSIADALNHYGPGPLFNLWSQVRASEMLCVAWTGKRPSVDGQ